MVQNASPPKEKRKPSEKRKEKSRNAARCRRSKESEIFADLAAELPLSPSVVSHLDKASIMRLVITRLRLMNIFKKIEEKKALKKDTHDEFFLNTIGGFVAVLALEGDIIFVSNNVSTYLGISQVDLLGQSAYEVIHPCDHSEIKDVLSVKNDPQEHSSFFIRMKCTLSSKGRSINLKSASYKVFHINGRFMDLQGSVSNCEYGFVTIATPISHPSSIEIPLGRYIFCSKHSLDMKFTYADEKMFDFLGYHPSHLIGKSIYEYHHAQDNSCIEKAYKSLFLKGQTETGMYRFLAQGGGYVWVSTQATIIYCEKGTKPLSVVCVNYVISEKLNEKEVYSMDQLEWSKENVKPIELEPEPPALKMIMPIKSETRPQPATRKIFAPKTADMNKGFLTFDDDESGTTLKDEPDDLTYLAPTAGDVCVLLESMPILDEDWNYFSTGEEISPLTNVNVDTSLFSTYNDDCSNTSLSPGGSGCSLPSLAIESPSFEEPSMKSILGLDLIDSDTDDLTKGQYLYDEDIPSLMPFDMPWNINLNSNSDTSLSCSPIPHDGSKDVLPELQSLLNDDEIPVQAGFFQLNPKDMSELESRKRSSPPEQENVKKRKHQFLSVMNYGNNDSTDIQNLLVTHGINDSYILAAQDNAVTCNFQTKIS